MSRHRAEPDDEAPVSGASADTGPLIFGRSDWPPVQDAGSASGNGSSATDTGYGHSGEDHFAGNHLRDDGSLTAYLSDSGHEDSHRTGQRGGQDAAVGDAPPSYRAELHNHRTSEIAYPLSRRPLPTTPAEPEVRSPRARPVEPRPTEPRPEIGGRQGPSPMQPPAIDADVADAVWPPADEDLVEDSPLDDPADELDLLEPPAEKGHRRGKRGPREGRRRPLAVLVTLSVIAALVTGIFYGGRAVVDLISADPAADYTGQGTDDVEIEVPDGASTSRIAEILAENDVVASAQAFLDAAEGNPDILTIQPGVYALRLKMSGQAAVDLILDPASRLFDRVTIPEGFTAARTLESLAEQTDIPLADFEAAAAAPEQLGLPAWADGQIEGFLYPTTYDVEPGTTAVQVLSEMVAQFNAVATETGLEANAAAVGLSPYEVMIVASLIQAEVTVEAERPLVARVIYNRLEASMPLGIDAALAYDLQINGGQLTTEMLQTDTPYNTRLRVGLPPTPISNPGQPSILGALNPAPGNWLYYVLQTNQGDHLFTADYEEFLAAKAQCEAEGLGCG